MFEKVIGLDQAPVQQTSMAGLPRGKLNEIVRSRQSPAMVRSADDASLFEGKDDLLAVLSKIIWDPDAQLVQQ